MTKGTDQATSAMPVRQAAQCYYLEELETSNAYSDVVFNLDSGNRSTEILHAGHAISGMIRALAKTQDCLAKVFARPHPDYPWREIVSATNLVADTDTVLVEDTLRDWQYKIQIKEGSTSGGTVTIGVTLK